MNIQAALEAPRFTKLTFAGCDAQLESRDILQATKTVRRMVTRWGMSDKLGPVSFGREDHQVFLGRDLAHEERNYSESSAIEIDREVLDNLEVTLLAADLGVKRRMKCWRACANRSAGGDCRSRDNFARRWKTKFSRYWRNQRAQQPLSRCGNLPQEIPKSSS
jgi:hypothetical protein